MNQINFEKHNPSTVEIGQIRADGDEIVLIIESENSGIYEMSELSFNAIAMNGRMKFRTLYSTPQSVEEIKLKHPKLIDVHEIKIITKEDI